MILQMISNGKIIELNKRFFQQVMFDYRRVDEQSLDQDFFAPWGNVNSWNSKKIRRPRPFPRQGRRLGPPQVWNLFFLAGKASLLRGSFDQLAVCLPFASIALCC
jgi:hypothetical protein